MDSLVCKYYEREKTWSTPKVEPIYNYECSMGRILFTTMNSHPSSICQIDAVTGKATTNREAITWGTRIALYFKSLRLDHNDVVGISACNSTYVLPAVLGCFFNCTPFHAVNPLHDENTLAHCFGITQPNIVFCDGRDYERIRKATASFGPKIFTLTDEIAGVSSIQDLLKPVEMEEIYQPEKQRLGARQTVAMVCSSGTTGKPKAVCLHSFALLSAIETYNSESTILVFSGLDWFTGVFFLTASCLRGSTRIITRRTFSSEYFLEVVQKYKVTIVLLPSRHIAALLQSSLATKEALKSINTLHITGAGLAANKLRRCKELLSHNAIVEFGYGFTEFNFVAVNCNMAKTKSVGKLLPNIKLRIVDGKGRCAGPNQVGEILLYKKLPWNGYYANPSETQRMVDPEGWYHSGDLGYMDDKCCLHLVDRKRDILKYQGMQYWPKEIEDVITQLPDVIEACVVGVLDECNGDAAGALVVQTRDSSRTEQQIIEHVAKSLRADYKQLHAGVHFVNEIPHNPNGKIMRNAAKSLFQLLGKQNGVV